MSDPNPATVTTALAELERILVASEGEPGGGRSRPLPEDWKDHPVKVLIAMVLARPDRDGVAAALAWFYGRGLPDPAGPPGDGLLDVGAVILEVLQRAVESAGIETVRQRFDEAFGDDAGG